MTKNAKRVSDYLMDKRDRIGCWCRRDGVTPRLKKA